MDNPETAVRARTACLGRHGIDVSLELITGGRHVLYRMASRVAPMLHAHGGRRHVVAGAHHGSVTSKAFRRMTEAERVDVLVEAVVRDHAYNEAHYAQIAEALASTPELARDLSRLHATLTWSSGSSAQIKVEWRGIGNDLAHGRQVHHIEHDRSAGYAAIAAKLATLARRERRLRLLSANTGVTLDAPLEAFVRSNGRTPEEFVEAARAHGFCTPRESRYDAGPAPMEFAGRTISVTFTDGVVSSRFELGEGVSWSKGCLTARDLVLPDSVVTSIRGRRLRDVVDHPWLEGLVASSAVQTVGKSGACVTIMTKRAA